MVAPGVISGHLKGAIGGVKHPAGSASPHREFPLVGLVVRRLQTGRLCLETAQTAQVG